MTPRPGRVRRTMSRVSDAGLEIIATRSWLRVFLLLLPSPLFQFSRRTSARSLIGPEFRETNQENTLLPLLAVKHDLLEIEELRLDDWTGSSCIYRLRSFAGVGRICGATAEEIISETIWTRKYQITVRRALVLRASEGRCTRCKFSPKQKAEAKGHLRCQPTFARVAPFPAGM